MRPQPLQHHGGTARPGGGQVPQLAVPVAVVTTRLWLLGHGIAHSPSPAMFNAALRACGLPWTYSIHDVFPAQLPEAPAALRRGGVPGAHATIPPNRARAQAGERPRGG